jgi:hypothetical protein
LKELTNEIKGGLHDHYLHCRKLLKTGFGVFYTTRIFENIFYDMTVFDNSWESTHISEDAIKRLLSNPGSTITGVQRCHGIVNGRLDRLVRTRTLLEGHEQPFNEWYHYYRKHDLTVLLTKEEHRSEKPGKLHVIPAPLKLFQASGFGFKKRKRIECVWMKKILSQNK